MKKQPPNPLSGWTHVHSARYDTNSHNREMGETYPSETLGDWRERMRRMSNAAALDDFRQHTFPMLQNAGVDTTALESVVRSHLGRWSPLPKPIHSEVALVIAQLGKCVGRFKELALAGNVPGLVVRQLEEAAVSLSDVTGVGLGSPPREPGAPAQPEVMEYADALESTLRPLARAKRYRLMCDCLMHTLPTGYPSKPESLERQLRAWRRTMRKKKGEDV